MPASTEIPTIFEHKVKTADAGWLMLAISPITAMLFISGLLYSGTGIFWQVVGSLLAAGIAAVVAFYGLSKIQHNAILSYILTESDYAQEIPDYHPEPSYRLALAEITAIEHHVYRPAPYAPLYLPPRTIHVWFLHTADDRHPINSKRAEQFARKIQQLRPELKLLRTGVA